MSWCRLSGWTCWSHDYLSFFGAIFFSNKASFFHLDRLIFIFFILCYSNDFLEVRNHSRWLLLVPIAPSPHPKLVWYFRKRNGFHASWEQLYLPDLWLNWCSDSLPCKGLRVSSVRHLWILVLLSRKKLSGKNPDTAENTFIYPSSVTFPLDY